MTCCYSSKFDFPSRLRVALTMRTDASRSVGRLVGPCALVHPKSQIVRQRCGRDTERDDRVVIQEVLCLVSCLDQFRVEVQV